MKSLFLYIAGPVFLTISADTAYAKTFDLGPVQADLRLNLDLQAATIIRPDKSSTVETNLDWASRLKLNYKIRPDTHLGAVIKLDQDFESGSEFSMRDGGLNRRLSYLYAKGKWGEIAIGNKSGQADLMSLHAPQVGIGQIRGDFSRYNFRSTLLNPYDTQNAIKIDYASPNNKPLKVGISYAPEIRDRRDNSLRQRDAIEIAVQSRAIVKEQWQLSTSAAYVDGNSANETRQDIKSWSLGAQLKYQKQWTLAGAYVSRGDSDARLVLNEDEFNIGIAYTRKKWRIGLSGAKQSNDKLDRTILGLGGEYKINRHLRLRVSGTLLDETTDHASSKGTAPITDLRLAY